MSRTGDSHEFTVVLGLPPGVYFYKFVENNQWKNDPRQPVAVEPNSQQQCNVLQIQ